MSLKDLCHMHMQFSGTTCQSQLCFLETLLLIMEMLLLPQMEGVFENARNGDLPLSGIC